MKYLKKFEDNALDAAIEQSVPEYYINTPNYYTPEQKEEFMFWYDRIKPSLKDNDELKVFNILLDWNKECLQKFDLYSLVMNYFKVHKILNKYNL